MFLTLIILALVFLRLESGRGMDGMVKFPSNFCALIRSETKDVLNLAVIFLDASSHLYKRVCPSVRPSVCLSVRLYVRPLRLFKKHRLPSYRDADGASSCPARLVVLMT